MKTTFALLAIPFWVQFAVAESPPGSLAYVLQADSFAKTKSVAVERLAACERDWIVLDAVFGGDTPWERAELDAIRRGRPVRKVIAYISIGEVEDYRPYWRKEWGGKGQLTTYFPEECEVICPRYRMRRELPIGARSRAVHLTVMPLNRSRDVIPNRDVSST